MQHKCVYIESSFTSDWTKQGVRISDNKMSYSIDLQRAIKICMIQGKCVPTYHKNHEFCCVEIVDIKFFFT